MNRDSPGSLTQVFKITRESQISSIINSNHLSPAIIKSKLSSRLQRVNPQNFLLGWWLRDNGLALSFHGDEAGLTRVTLTTRFSLLSDS